MAKTTRPEEPHGDIKRIPSWLADYTRLLERARARVEFLKIDSDFVAARKKWLRHIHKRVGYRAEELLDVGDALERLRVGEQEKWREFQQDLDHLGIAHGVPPYQVLLAMLVRNYALGDRQELWGAPPAV